MPAGILAANVPDADIVTAFGGGGYASLGLRRGWTHGPPAVLLGAIVVLLLMIAWDRFIRKRRTTDDDGDVRRVRVGPMLLLVLIAAATHPVLDWMNTYGIRWLMPLDRSWYYGDSLFIIDPWLWLLLAVPLFLIFSETRRAIVLWALSAFAASVIVLGTGMVPVAAKVIWTAAILAAAAWCAWRGPARARAQRHATVAVVLATLYVGGMVVNSRAMERVVREQLETMRILPADLMIAPLPGTRCAPIIVQQAYAYLPADFDWRASPRIDSPAAGRLRAVRPGGATAGPQPSPSQPCAATLPARRPSHRA